MLVSLDVSEYDPVRGLTLEWDNGFSIELSASGTEVFLAGNRAGLVSLARHLLVLAQDDVPAGHHLHLTAGQEIESSVDLILERRDA